jgi:hypothetical protein
MPGMNEGLAEQILDVLRRRDPPAAFVTEVAASLRPRPSASAVEDALGGLDRSGRVLVMLHAPPDVHLASTDLRVVACVPGADDGDARRAADDFWDGWLRAFLANHRCE